MATEEEKHGYTKLFEACFNLWRIDKGYDPRVIDKNSHEAITVSLKDIPVDWMEAIKRDKQKIINDDINAMGMF